MGKLYPVIQLDGDPDEGANCGPATSASDVAWETQGAVRPSPGDMRARMDPPEKNGGATNLPDLALAIKRLSKAIKAAGWKPRRLHLFDGHSITPKTGIRFLAKGWRLDLAIGYGRINLQHPEWSGSLTFMDGHSVSITGLYDSAGNVVTDPDFPGKLYTDLVDPLRDGRVRLIGGVRHKYPRGPVRMPLAFVFKLCGDLPLRGGGVLGQGRVLAGALPPAKRLATSTGGGHHEPDPCQAVEDERDALLERLRQISALASDGDTGALSAAAISAGQDGGES